MQFRHPHQKGSEREQLQTESFEGLQTKCGSKGVNNLLKLKGKPFSYFTWLLYQVREGLYYLLSHPTEESPVIRNPADQPAS
jgi:hypothetical protein